MLLVKYVLSYKIYVYLNFNACLLVFPSYSKPRMSNGMILKR